MITPSVGCAERSFFFMKQAVVFANGKMEKSQAINSLFQSSDLVIAADGGIRNCEALGIMPHVIIGDLDSMDANEITRYHIAGVELITFPPNKDESDLELALLYALEHEFHEVSVLGALGARWDMTVVNIFLMVHPKFSGMNIRLLDGTQELRLLQPGDRVELLGKPGDTLSLIPLVGDADGIITQGLEYTLNNETLQLGSSRGVSNVIISDSATVVFSQGLILCIINRDGNE